jgi:hypothetical protein
MSRAWWRRMRGLVSALYDSHPAACCMHVVVEDGNTSASALAVCAAEARRATHTTCMYIAAELGRLTVDERRRFVSPRSRR